MRAILICVLSYGLVSIVYAVPVTYKSVYNDPKKTAQPTFSNHQHQHRPRYPYPPQNYYPPYDYSHRPQVSVVTPNVQIYMTPQTQNKYQKTEEVYLPQGGTYRKTTEYMSQYPEYVPIQQRSRNILKQGHFYVEQEPN